MIPTLNTGYWWLDAYLYFCLSMFALMVYRRWLKNELAELAKWLTAPLLIVFFGIDVAANHTVFAALGPKPHGTWTISQRFEYYRQSVYPSGFNKTIANITCYVIDLFDPMHC